VNLMLKLCDMRREPRLREARRWFTGSLPHMNIPRPVLSIASSFAQSIVADETAP